MEVIDMSIGNIFPAVEMMIQGMIGIFVVLGIIALVVLFMQKIDRKY